MLRKLLIGLAALVLLLLLIPKGHDDPKQYAAGVATFGQAPSANSPSDLSGKDKQHTPVTKLEPGAPTFTYFAKSVQWTAFIVFSYEGRNKGSFTRTDTDFSGSWQLEADHTMTWTYGTEKIIFKPSGAGLDTLDFIRYPLEPRTNTILIAAGTPLPDYNVGVAKQGGMGFGVTEFDMQLVEKDRIELQGTERIFRNDNAYFLDNTLICSIHHDIGLFGVLEKAIVKPRVTAGALGVEEVNKRVRAEQGRGVVVAVNPFARLLLVYRHYFQGKINKSVLAALVAPAKTVPSESLTFDAFIELLSLQPYHHMHALWLPQSYLCSFEHLPYQYKLRIQPNFFESDWDIIAAGLNLPKEHTAPVMPVPVSDDEIKRTYSPRSRLLVFNKYITDFELFGFQFPA